MSPDGSHISRVRCLVIRPPETHRISSTDLGAGLLGNPEPVEGTRFTLQTTPAGEWDGVIHCEVLEVMRNERLSYSWRGGHDGNAEYGSRLDTVVTWTLAKVDGGTRLRVVHSGFVLPKNTTTFRNLSEGWKKVVGKIGVISGGRAY
jgi:uncharacterized protein YndB with AHSA1/START domain